MSDNEYSKSTSGGHRSVGQESGPGSSDSGDAETGNPEARDSGPDSAQVVDERLHGYAVRDGRAEWGDFYDAKGRLDGRGGPCADPDFGPATCPPGCADPGHDHWKRDPGSAPVNPDDPGGPRYYTEDGRRETSRRPADEERGDSRGSEDHGGPGSAFNERILRRGSESDGPQRLSDVPRNGGGQKFWERRSTGRGRERDADSSPGPEYSGSAEARSPGDSDGHTGEGQGEGGRREGPGSRRTFWERFYGDSGPDDGGFWGRFFGD